MLNPFGPQQDPGLFSYINLKKRTLQNVQAARVNDQIFEVVQKAYEDALKKENILLTRFEKKHLLAQIMKRVLTDMLKKLDKSSRV
jgi:hypothetical protein